MLNYKGMCAFKSFSSVCLQGHKGFEVCFCMFSCEKLCSHPEKHAAGLPEHTHNNVSVPLLLSRLAHGGWDGEEKLGPTPAAA